LPARHASDGLPFNASQPGLDLECARWLHAHDIAAVCADNVAVEVMHQPRNLPTMAFHMVALRDMGMLLGELFVLEELAADCARDGVYEFFFAAPPLNFPRAVGSPINPLAIK
jgi:kynurenine formamidase